MTDRDGNWTVDRDTLSDYEPEGFSRVRPLPGHGEDLMSLSSKFLQENLAFFKNNSLFSLFV